MWTALRKASRVGLAIKLGALILASTALIFLAAFGYNYHVSRQLVLKNVEENAAHLTQATVNRIETVLCGVEWLPRYVALTLENSVADRSQLEQLIRNMVNTNPAVFGAAIAFEPYAFDPAERYVALYGWRRRGRVQMKMLGSDDYQYHNWDWYLIPKTLDKALWSEPYYDEGGGQATMSTYSAPFYRTVKGERKFMGVVTVDVSLEWLADIVRSVSLYQSGYAFTVSQNGVFLSHPNKDYVMRESVFSVAEGVRDPAWREIGRRMIHGEKGFVPISSAYLGRKSWMYYGPLSSSGWSLGLLFPERELFADIRWLEEAMLLIGCAGFLLLFAVVAAVSTSIIRPLRILSDKTVEIAQGNWDVELPLIKSHDEIGDLTRSFENMRVSLKKYVVELKETEAAKARTEAAKERIESELKIARSIQMNFLPRNFPAFGDRSDFQIHALLEPAKEVGGDLYDFFLLDEENLFFSVGDVSDKGVPAALFMAVTKTLMKGIAEQELEPSGVLERVNVQLCPENDDMMFVTVFCGVLNLTTGELRYSNAGHNPPILLRRDGLAEWLKLPEGLVLGVMEDSHYGTHSILLEPGDTVICYTDGVTEAMNWKKEMYSDDRLLHNAGELAGKAPQEISERLMYSVDRYCDGAPQSDDITVLAVRFVGNDE